MIPFSRRGALAALFLSSAIILATPGATFAASTPMQLIEKFHETLLGVMKNAKDLGMQGRFDQIDPAIAEAFAVRTMIAIASGKTWKASTDDEKDAVTNAFRRVSASTYASHFKEYSGQTFETLGEKPGPRGTTLVETHLNDAGRGAVSIVYVTKQTKGAWKIIDVIIDKGISELALRKSEYRQILGNEGMSGLVATLNDKADTLLEEFGADEGVGGYGQ